MKAPTTISYITPKLSAPITHSDFSRVISHRELDHCTPTSNFDPKPTKPNAHRGVLAAASNSSKKGAPEGKITSTRKSVSQMRLQDHRLSPPRRATTIARTHLQSLRPRVWHGTPPLGPPQVKRAPRDMDFPAVHSSQSGPARNPPGSFFWFSDDP